MDHTIGELFLFIHPVNKTDINNYDSFMKYDKTNKE